LGRGQCHPAAERALIMKFVVTIRTDNAAFDADRATEVARILRDVAHQVETHRYICGYAMDINGNRVCKFAAVNALSLGIDA
jgi:hypothetical protein